MADKQQYVVTGHQAVFDTFTSDGFRRVSVYRGQRVPADASDAQIRHNLDVNLIAEVPGSEPTGTDSAGAAVVGGERAGEVPGEPGSPFAAANATTEVQGAQRLSVSKTAPAPSDDESTPDQTEAKRAAARSKLPADGGMPRSVHGQDVWVEYHVGQGGSYEDLAKQDKASLIELAKSRQQ